MSRVLLSSGIALNVEVSGGGPPVVLLHGFTGSARAWGAFGGLLAERHTVVAVDVVGHGQSDRPATAAAYTMPRAATDCVEAVRLAGFARAAWLGYSMGGRLALFVAAEHPAAVERLVLVGASAGLRSAQERRERVAADEALAARIEREGVPAFVDSWEALPLFATQRRLPAAARETIRAGRLANQPEGLAGSLRGMGTGAQPPLHDRLRAIATPTLVLAGAEDERYVTIGQDLASALPAGRFATVAGAGHAAHTECPADTARLVLAFLAEAAAEPTPQETVDHALR